MAEAEHVSVSGSEETTPPNTPGSSRRVSSSPEVDQVATRIDSEIESDGAFSLECLSTSTIQSAQSSKSIIRTSSLPIIIPVVHLEEQGPSGSPQSSLNSIPGGAVGLQDVPSVRFAPTSDHQASKDLRATYILFTLNKGHSARNTRSTLPARLPSRNLNFDSRRSNAPSIGRLESPAWVVDLAQSPVQVVIRNPDVVVSSGEQLGISEVSGHQGSEASQASVCDLRYLLTCGSFLKLGTMITCLAMSICAILLWQCQHEILSRTRYLIATGFIASISAIVTCGVRVANLTGSKISWITAECMAALLMFGMMVTAIILFVDHFCYLEKQAVTATTIYGCFGCLFLAADFIYLLVQRICLEY